MSKILNNETARQKNGRKMLIFRIFCELLAKTKLGSRINKGVPKDTVEMKKA